MSDELERRAAYGAQVHAQQVVAQQRPFTTRPGTPELNALATRSLAEAVKTRGLHADALVFLVTLLAAPLGGFLLRDDIMLAIITGVAIATVGITCTIIAMVRRTAQQCRRALGWFDTLPFAVDKRRYLELLGQERSGTRIELQIVFTATPTSQEMEMFANAASGSAAIAHRESQGNVLVLTGVPVKTYFWSRDPDRASYHSNQPAHAWMLSVTDGALRLIHQRQPIERVEVKMESYSIVD